MTDTLTRRDFFRWTGAFACAGFLPWRLGPAAGGMLDAHPTGAPVSSGPAPNGDLPPRTIGLRTLGGDFRFDPAGLRIEAADRVVWLNMGDFHTTSAFHPDNARLLKEKVPLRIPESAEPWHSGMLGLTAGTEFEHEFEVEGVYDYFCQPHYNFGMVGRIIVGRPGGGPAVSRPLSELNEASRAVIPSVDTIMGPEGRAYEWAARINGILLLRGHEASMEGAVKAVESGVEADAELGNVLGDAGAASRFRERLAAFLDGAVEGADYEKLVRRADAAKDVLREARRAD